MDKLELLSPAGDMERLETALRFGADAVYDMANQFDLYNNGGLDICFMGGIEVDKLGNVNAHRSPGTYAGIGGFANITAKTGTVVFCLTFNTKGLDVDENEGKVTIKNNGSLPKFVDKVAGISFSAKRAHANGQKVLYVTERCVFDLGEKGLRLIEVYPGVDMHRDILNIMPAAIMRPCMIWLNVRKMTLLMRIISHINTNQKRYMAELTSMSLTVA